MRLFDMTEDQLDSVVQTHFDHMFNAYYHLDEPEPCCNLCRYYDGDQCEKISDILSEEEWNEMEESGDFSEVKRDSDDYCDDFNMKDPDYPVWADF